MPPETPLWSKVSEKTRGKVLKAKPQKEKRTTRDEKGYNYHIVERGECT